MIIPMVKYAFVLHHNSLDSFLADLQKLGMVDVERYSAQLDDNANNLFLQSERYDSIYKQLCLIDAGDEQLKPISGSVEDLLNSYEALIVEREQLDNKAKRLEKDILEAEPWGVFDNDIIDKISALGLTPHFYAVYDKSYKAQWENEYVIQQIGRAHV